jgi:hypothetical protein
MDLSWKSEDIPIFCKLWMACHLSELRHKFQNAKLCLCAYMKTSLTLFPPLKTYTSFAPAYIVTLNCEVCIHMFWLTKQINACLDSILVIYLKQCILHSYGIGPSFTSYCVFRALSKKITHREIVKVPASFNLRTLGRL